MKQKKWCMTLCFLTAITLLSTGCGKTDAITTGESNSSTADTSADTNTNTNTDTDSSTTDGQTLSTIDSDGIGVTADEDDLCSEYTSYDAEITLADNATSVSGDNTAGVSISGNQITIHAGGTYYLTGTLSDGQLLISGEEKVKLYLDGVSITNTTGTALICVNEKRTILSLADGTENNFSDGSSYTAVTIDTQEIDPSAIYAQDKLTINGSGNLTVSGNCDGGIICKDDLKLVGGTITVTAVENGIKGKDCVALLGADVIVTAGNDGVKATETEDESKGFLQLDSGSLTITTGGDCLQAETLIRISGGSYTLTTDGTAIDADTDESNSAKGIHCTYNGEILGGEITVSAVEDGIHCGGTLCIEDGTLTIDSSEDGIQADGDLTQTGGTLTITTTGEVSSSSSYDDFGGGGDMGGGRGGMGMSSDGTGADVETLTTLQLTETETTTEDDTSTSSKGVKCGGNLVMNGGSCTITSTDHAVHATGTADFSGTTLSLSSDNKGISTHGNLTISDGSIVILTATEGIESKADLTVSGGTIQIQSASDDGMNTGGTGDTHAMTFSGGYTYVCADGDGIDSNATLDITGGTLIVCGPTTGADGSIDFETTMTYTGGTLLALSYNGMMEYSDSGLLVTTGASASAGDQISVVDADGTVLATVTTPKAVSDIIFGIGDNDSSEYQILVGGTYSGTLDENGFGTGGTISGGTEVSITTSGGMGGGMQGGMGDQGGMGGGRGMF